MGLGSKKPVAGVRSLCVIRRPMLVRRHGDLTRFLYHRYPCAIAIVLAKAPTVHFYVLAFSMPTFYTRLASEIGPLLLTSNGHAITRLQMHETSRRQMSGTDAPVEISAGWTESGDPFVEVERQLRAYFDGHRRSFDLSLAPTGTPFQQRVWAALQNIPFGTTCTYGDIARQIGQPRAAQAVGAANAQNPIALLIPCHRVVGADGSLTGYAGGLDRKRHLLRLEATRSGLFAAPGKAD